MAGYGIILTGLLVILYVRKRKREMNPDGAKRKGAQARKRERMLFGITMFLPVFCFLPSPGNVFHYSAGRRPGRFAGGGERPFVMLNDGGSSSASAVGEKGFSHI